MALQLLYSSWLEDGVKKSFRAASKGLIDDDVTYIFDNTEKRLSFDQLPDDEENSDNACIVYLRLPSDAVAIVRTGYYSLDEDVPKNGFVLHAYVTEIGEEISPFLYVVNTCFKQTFTREELVSYSSYSLLPTVPFPEPQLVLSQEEVQQFFSLEKQKTLSHILQALIDGHRSKRMTILNEKHSLLKYWFYAIHCCLPEYIKKEITFATSVYDKLEDCELVCGAIKNRISTINEMAHGNFVFDHLGGPTIENVEAVKYPVYISQLFVESAGAAKEVSQKIHDYMNQYQMSLSTSVGVMKLLACEFDWFESVYDIQFFWGKIGFADKDCLKKVVLKLWDHFQKRAFNFELNEQSLPLLSCIFKNSDSSVRREIIEYVDRHREQFGIYQAMSIKDYYTEIVKKLGFIYEFLPSALLRNNQFDAYRDYINRDLNELSILLYIIVDNYDALTDEHGEEAVHSVCREILLMLLNEEDFDLAVAFCRKAEDLPDTFIEQVVVRAVWIYAEQLTTRQGIVNEELVLAIMEELIQKTRAAAAVLMVFARKGRYGENIVSMYMDLCRKYPNETAAIDAILSRREVFSDFQSDMMLQKFMSQKKATLDDLSYFFYHFYLKERDKNQSFESKLQELLETASHFWQIEVADHILRLFANTCSDYQEKRIVQVLASYVVNQSVNDLYDYYANSDVDIREVTDILLSINCQITHEFYAAILCVDLKDIVSKRKKQISEVGKKLIAELEDPYIVSELPPYNAENKLFLDRLYRYLLRALVMLAHKKRGLVQQYDKIFENFLTRCDFQEVLINFICLFEETSEAKLEPLLASLLLLKIKGMLVGEGVYEAVELYLMEGKVEKRRARFSVLLSYSGTDTDRNLLKEYLTVLFYSDMNFVKRLFAPSPQNLFQ